MAMANKNARILWAVMTREEGFNPSHVSIKPNAKQQDGKAVADLAPIYVAGVA